MLELDFVLPFSSLLSRVTCATGVVVGVKTISSKYLEVMEREFAEDKENCQSAERNVSMHMTKVRAGVPSREHCLVNHGYFQIDRERMQMN